MTVEKCYYSLLCLSKYGINRYEHPGQPAYVSNTTNIAYNPGITVITDIIKKKT